LNTIGLTPFRQGNFSKIFSYAVHLRIYCAAHAAMIFSAHLLFSALPPKENGGGYGNA
jgi:hypothetical protein